MNDETKQERECLEPLIENATPGKEGMYLHTCYTSMVGNLKKGMPLRAVARTLCELLFMVKEERTKNEKLREELDNIKKGNIEL